MSWEDIAQRAVRDAVTAFGEGVTYTSASGEAVTIIGDFQAQHQAVDPNTGVPFYSTEPVMTVVLADLPAGCPDMGDTVMRKGKTYRVIGDQPDGDGGTLLELKL